MTHVPYSAALARVRPVCALGEGTPRVLERDRLSAIAIGRAMVRWAATVYHVDGGQEQAVQ